MKPSSVIKHICRYVTDALSDDEFDLTENPVTLVGWQCGFEPMFVACKSYLPGIKLTPDDAVELATDLLVEKEWFSGEPTEPSYIIQLPNQTPAEKALVFYHKEEADHGLEFDHDGCIEDIHRIYGKEIADEIESKTT